MVRVASLVSRDRLDDLLGFLSAVMMFEHLGWNEAPCMIVSGMERAIKEGVVTYDLARLMRPRGR